jgi:AraC-like DNA-binding protein
LLPREKGTTAAIRPSVLTRPFPSSSPLTTSTFSTAPRMWRMRAATSAEDFAQSPVGSYLLTDRALYWCASADLVGIAAWGSPTVEEADQAVLLWDHIVPQLARPFDLVIDVRRVTSITQPTFARLHELAAPRMGGRGSIRRQLVLTPPGLAGAVVAGFCNMMSFAHDWTCLGDDATGFAWLGRPDGASVRAMVDALAARGEGDLVPRLRALLVRDLAAASVPTAARALGVSPRSLQRHLAAAGTSFRRELRRARIEAARELLAGTRATVESVARSVGCESPSSFIRMFRSITGETPATFRARAGSPHFQPAPVTA